MGGQNSGGIQDNNPVNFTFVHNLDNESRVWWTVVCTAIMVIAAGGNLIVIWIVATNPRMRTVTNYFLLNLAVADALIATLSMPFQASYIVTQDWALGSAMCKVARFFGTVSVAASVLSLVAVSVDRYRAIVHPLLPRLSKSYIVCMIVVIWGGSAVFASPFLFYSRIISFTYLGDVTKRQCLVIWPDGILNHIDFTYNVITFVLLYCLPLATLAACYTVIGVKLWHGDVLGEYIPNRARQLKAKRKVVKMIVLVIAVFAVCWFPLHVYQFLAFLHDDIYMKPYAVHIYLSIWTIAMSCSMYNPFIYCWLNDRFRAGFKRVFRCLVPKSKSSSDGKGLGRRIPLTPTASSAAATSTTGVNRNIANGKPALLCRTSIMGISVVDSTDDIF
ncbi:tachykinin-like peptides receptor 99D isoform X1 [Acanthaster planci]|uniref:Tachykinin-like peptides receptor 99D isoform X1 n=1 Tax=Acanthaster planci TaxID=133434 RepID=A0A8B7XMG6_ACAPL|nr:tachykinin-like peptides receptor 99D isoform X1 [Acanthaster planci]XP_022081366.1 tachykinin-like peptides receptor 99D isoform X1 [Acanthaster planci]XP_022081376.1 tachykinin-like peptides receptor 99D isoform X1 [Acanthaster planci]XP_022081385.1 tachykinin-like peptides receptor 99D isoform X1 [Acanthaster planci]